MRLPVLPQLLHRPHPPAAGIVGWLVVLWLVLAAGPSRATLLNPTDWTRDPILSRFLVKDIVFDPRGFRWVATDEGVFRYDGYNLTPLERLTRGGDPFPAGKPIYSLVLDQYGNLWLGGQPGLFRFELRTARLREIRLAGQPMALASVFRHPRSGQLWVSFNKHLAVLTPETAGWRTLSVRPLPFRTHAIQADATGDGVWLSTLPNYRTISPTGPEGSMATIHLQLAPTGSPRRTIRSKGYMVPVPGTAPLRLFSISGWFEATPNDSVRLLKRWLPANREFEFRPLALRDSVRQWIALSHLVTLTISGPRAGQVRLEPLILPGTDLRLHDGHTLLADPHGVVWGFSIGWRGVFKQRPVRQLVQPLVLPNKLRVPSTRTVRRLPDGRLLVGTYAGVFAQAADSPNAPLRPWPLDWGERALALPVVYDVTTTRAGPLLVTLDGFGFYTLAPATSAIRLLPYAADSADRPPITFARSVWEDHLGRLWGGTSGGLFRIDLRRRRVERVVAGDLTEQLRTLDISDVCEDAATGALWLATATGLYWFDPNPAHPVLQRLALVPTSGHSAPVEGIFCVASVGPGRVWVGTNGAGLLLADRTRGLRRQISTGEGLPSPIVATLLVRPDGRVWAGTYAGLACYEPPTGRLTAFTQADGFVDAELNRNAACVDPVTGRLLFGGVDGVYGVRPEVVLQAPTSTQLLLMSTVERSGTDRPAREQLLAGTAPAAPLHLAASEAAGVELRLALSDLLTPELSRYAYRLRYASATEFLTDWLPTPPRLTLRSLPAGEYVVEIRGETASGQPARNQLQVRLTVAQVWWRHPLALLAAAVALVAFGYGLYWLRLQRLLREARLRAELAANLHDEVGALLTRVNLLAEVLRDQHQPAPAGDSAAGRTETPTAFDRLLFNSRAAVQTMRDVVWSIDSRADTVGALVDRLREFLDQTARAANFVIDFQPEGLDADARLKAAVRQHVYLICKEAVTNAVRHGRGVTRITVRLARAGGDGLLLEVCDDGQTAPPPVPSAGMGQRNMAERAAALGARLTVGPRPDGRPGYRVCVEPR